MKKQRGISGPLASAGVAVGILAGWLGLGLTTARAGTITEISPFIGDISEDWESFPNPLGKVPHELRNPTTIMGGAATAHGQHMTIFHVTDHTLGLGWAGTAQPSDGAQGMVLAGPYDSTGTIEFYETAVAFGAFWGAATGPEFEELSDPTWINLEFFSVSDELIGSFQFAYSRPREPLPGAIGDGMLEWHGWSFDEPISRINYTGDIVAIDGLQAQLVPEPGSLVLTVAGFLLAICRNRPPQVRELIESV